MKSNSILIISVPRDSHARAVEWALTETGSPVTLAMYSDFPQKLSYSERINGADASLTLSQDARGEIDSAYAVVWRRRIGAPMVDPMLHASDLLIAEKEAGTVRDSLERYFDAKAELSVNSFTGHQRSKNKPVQLRIAAETEMAVPDTLISNCPKSIREFSKEYGGNIIFKSFTSPTWQGSGVTYFTFTKKIPRSLLQDDAALSAAPAIYQERIDKTFEVRALFMGNQHLAVRLGSQELSGSEEDWRRQSTANLRVEPHVLPDEVVEKCREMMRRLGIVTGSFDFAVDREGRYVFFEVNEQGQFLWMEQRCPSVPTLDVFTDFLQTADREYVWSGVRRPNITFGKYAASGAWDAALQQEAKLNLQYEIRPPYRE